MKSVNYEPLTEKELQTCLPRIRAIYPDLRPAEQKVADIILSQPAEVSTISSVELARRAGVSDATVVKCSQNLGFDGFTQLKLALVRELATAPEGAFGEITPDDTVAEVRDKTFHSNVQALTDTIKVLDVGELQRAVEAIQGARHVDFFGVGASGVVAMDAQLKFMRIGIDCGFYADAHVQATRAALLKPEDLAIVITHSGQTRDAVEVLRLANEAGAGTVCVTNYPRSPAARLAQIVLLTSSHETDLRSGALGSRLAQLTVIDCLFMAVAIRDFDQAMSFISRTRAAVSSRKV